MFQYWDKKIASIAQRYANSCPRGHDTSEDRSVEGTLKSFALFRKMNYFWTNCEYRNLQSILDWTIHLGLSLWIAHDFIQIGSYLFTGYNVYIGQNLAWGYANWKAALSAWHGEVTMYRYGVDPETYLGPDGWGKIGHYTQVQIFNSITSRTTNLLYM